MRSLRTPLTGPPIWPVEYQLHRVLPVRHQQLSSGSKESNGSTRKEVDNRGTVAEPTKRRKSSGTSPTQLSLAKLREEGWFVWIVEHWNHFARKRQDLWGFADLLALRGEEVLAVQTTTDANVAARVNKIADHDNVGHVRQANILIHVHGWEKRDGKWHCRVVDCS